MNDIRPAARRLQQGEPAPSPEVFTPDGPRPLSAFWHDGPIVLTFLRHFG